jgi:hypothetical protein
MNTSSYRTQPAHVTKITGVLIHSLKNQNSIYANLISSSSISEGEPPQDHPYGTLGRSAGTSAWDWKETPVAVQAFRA